MNVVAHYSLPSAVQLVVFDLDGTLLAHNYRHWCSEAARIFPLLGGRVSDEETILMDYRRDDMFASLPADGREALVDQFWTLYDDTLAPRPSLIAGAAECIASLRRAGVVVAIATAREESPAEITDQLQTWGLGHYVAVVATRHGRACSVYDKLPLVLDVMRATGVPPDHACMIGDLPADIAAAKRAGLAVQIGVCSGGLNAATLAITKPTALVHSVAFVSSERYAHRR